MVKKKSEELDVVEPPTTTEQVALEPAKKNKSQLIWESIKDLPIELFALPNQKVSMHCKYVPISNDVCFVQSTLTSFLPMLELAVSTKFNVEMQDKFILVSEKPQDKVVEEKAPILVSQK